MTSTELSRPTTSVSPSIRRLPAHIWLRWLGTILAILLCPQAGSAAGRLEKEFRDPPAEARPWVYWFWLNGNITSNGITVDLEAMKRAGIGGVLIMEVDQGVPAGPVDFMGPAWRALFGHAAKECGRLGLELNMNNDAGWNGSGGPWIAPAQSMQKVVWTETNVSGPLHFDGALPQPQTVAGFYKEISVLAFPAVGAYRIPNIKHKAAFEMGDLGGQPPGSLPADTIIERQRIQSLSAKMDPNGRLVWDVPAGQWTILRFGHTATGVENAPAPASGRGLECDKLSKEGITANFDGMMRRLVAGPGLPQGPRGGLVATHIDSWENGSQNWTARMPGEFQRRRGYALEPFLPIFSGRVVESFDISERVLWDLRQTVSELVIENYAGEMRRLAHTNGMRFTIEAYGSPCDFIPYAGQSDEPMGEFWTPSGSIETCKGMASAAHVYGKRIVGAEAFTAGDHERWREHPASLKALGDQAFCEGINRFVFHRYALQPWAQDLRPGMTMGPWGQHYERTQTWWEQTLPWHQYLARCQHLLRQGLFVADICYLQAEAPPHGFGSHPRKGYDWDECGAEVVLERMSVRDGRLVLPDGMSYRLLALPPTDAMTPRLLRRVKELVEAGATVLGAPPKKSPSFNGFPQCDAEVRQLAAELWAGCDGTLVKELGFGKGKVVRGIEPEQWLRGAGLGPDFASAEPLRYFHRALEGTDIYFVANSARHSLTAAATFRVAGRQPELWWPESGRIERAALTCQSNGQTTVTLSLDPAGSVFVIFRKTAGPEDAVVSCSRNGAPLLSPAPDAPANITLQRAVYGVLSDPQRTREVSQRVRQFLDRGETSFQVARMADGDDPAYGIVKTLELAFTLGGKRVCLTGTDPDIIDLRAAVAPDRIAELRRDPAGRLSLEAWQAGRYEVRTASGRILRHQVASLPPPLDLSDQWTVTFPPGSGAPAAISLPQLGSLSLHSDPGVRYFSGTATYRKTFSIPRAMLGSGQRLYLDLGDVQVMAQVILNRRDLGILWKTPFCLDVTAAARAGENTLELKVVNLWPNRLIGDAQLPADGDRNANGTLKSWPQWLLDGQPSPAGRITFTTWELWHKTDALLPSGLIGPVRLLPATVSVLK